MLSDPRVKAFEAGAVDPKAFGHREHLHVAWCYLKSLTLEDALARYVHYLRRLAHALGVPEKYHATITWAYLVLLHDAMQDSDLDGAPFEAILEKYPQLLDHKQGMLFDYYDRAEINSEMARRRFVLPRVKALQGRRKAS
jgi:hypothetical protein